MMYKQHILKSIITVRLIEPVVCNFRRKSTNVRNLFNFLFNILQFLVGHSFISLLVEKISHLTHSNRFYKKLVGLSSNSTYLTL